MWYREQNFLPKLPKEILRTEDHALQNSLQFEEIYHPPISAAYESSFLEEPRGGERTCVAALTNSCQGTEIARRATFQQGTGGAPLKEFLTPTELAEYEATGKYPESRKFCLACLRFVVSMALFSRECMNLRKYRGNICPHSVRIDEPGEYDSRVCLYAEDPTAGCDRAFVQHADNNYIYTQREDGRVALQQVNVFYTPPPKNDLVDRRDRDGSSTRADRPYPTHPEYPFRL